MLMEIENNNSNAVNPELCRQVGKDCRECVSSNAGLIALLCPTMDAASAQQMFSRLYRSQACAVMERAFVREYLAAVEPEFTGAPTPVPLYQIAACA
jgi:hypothetical protein